MARPSNRKRSDLAEAVAQLRSALGDTQQQFAARLGTAITTIARYETIRPPQGAALAQFINLARASGQPELADIFQGALSAQLGYDVVPLPPAETGLPSVPGEAREIEFLKMILRGATIGFPELVKMRDRWYKLRQPLEAKNTKRDADMAAMTGLFIEVKNRILRGESDEAIIAALPGANSDITKKAIQGWKDGGLVPTDAKGDAK
jgi:transcriptional regulator with XRE-family HTH domain